MPQMTTTSHLTKTGTMAPRPNHTAIKAACRECLHVSQLTVLELQRLGREDSSISVTKTELA